MIRTMKRRKRFSLVGQRFGRLVVLAFAGWDKWQCRTWECRCDCGAIAIVKTSYLRSGKTQSCGCLHKETLQALAKKRHVEVEMRRNPTYKSWEAMKRRCRNPRATNFRYYGGKGVKVCKRWQSFANFLDDMGHRPVGTTLGRLLDMGDYRPGNCAWMNRSEQEQQRQLRKAG